MHKNNKMITEHNLELGYPCYVTDMLWGVRDNQRIQLYCTTACTGESWLKVVRVEVLTNRIMHGIYILVSSILSRTVKEYFKKSSISQWRNIAGNHQHHHGSYHSVCTVSSCKAGLFIVFGGLLSAWILAIYARSVHSSLERVAVQHLPLSICDTKYRKYKIVSKTAGFK